ncbi:MAG: hypothetical protein ABR577_19210, partial [Pyrinomonadaceae bacterium]
MSESGKPAGAGVTEQVGLSKSLADVSPPQAAGASATGAFAAVVSEGGSGTRVGRFRWLICALLF